MKFLFMCFSLVSFLAKAEIKAVFAFSTEQQRSEFNRIFEELEGSFSTPPAIDISEINTILKRVTEKDLKYVIQGPLSSRDPIRDSIPTFVRYSSSPPYNALKRFIVEKIGYDDHVWSLTGIAYDTRTRGSEFRNTETPPTCFYHSDLMVFTTWLEDGYSTCKIMFPNLEWNIQYAKEIQRIHFSDAQASN